ncbi:aldose 1-epimerase [Alicyclobacillus sp. ALC3]|nr:aldose 1-epimerase [Alicyclobacillus sp. ALC3]
MQPSTQDITYLGEPAVLLRAGPYEAIVLPAFGANLISFRDRQRDLRFIREPDSMRVLREKPVAYGIPFLFPPNRYESGEFDVNGVQYRFPINEPEHHNHLHGMLYAMPWTVESTDSGETTARVVLQHAVDDRHPMFAHFPHVFVITIDYELSAKGLTQRVRVVNKGTQAMPCMVGFHTAIQVPFSDQSSVQDYRTMVTVGERWELDERHLPTGSLLPLSEYEADLARQGAAPFAIEMDNHYTANPQCGRNFASIEDAHLGLRLVYDAGTKYRHWMLWNDEAGGQVFCPEPQTNVVNAPNLGMDATRTGLLVLGAGESWQEESQFYLVNL